MKVFACVECGSREHRLGNGKEVYPHRPDLYSKPIWFCECGAYVGCHPGTKKALGSPCGPLTNRARIAAHTAFDPIWRSKMMGRNDAYKWLAARLGIEPKDCHISQMDKAMAYRAAKVSREYIDDRNADQSNA